MKTNELKKGQTVRLRNGWTAEIWDNRKGNRRTCKVYGFETEISAVYAHDIVEVRVQHDEKYTGLGTLRESTWKRIEHTPEQEKLRKMAEAFGYT